MANLMRNVVFGAIVSTGFLGAVAIPATSATAQNLQVTNPVPTIEVSASGSSELAPDMAILNLGVVREAKTAREALSANNRAMGAVIAALKEAGIEKKDLQTSNFRVQPRYQNHTSTNSNTRRRILIGYSVSNSLSVRVRDLKILGDILDKTVSLGVNSGGNVRFTNDDPSAAITIARTKAIKNAIAKAETLTKAANAKLGVILSINEGVSRHAPVQLAQARGAFSERASDSVPLATGENSYSVRVTVRWKIEQ